MTGYSSMPMRAGGHGAADGAGAAPGGAAAAAAHRQDAAVWRPLRLPGPCAYRHLRHGLQVHSSLHDPKGAHAVEDGGVMKH